jgi:predicted Zn-dependent protease
MPDLDALLGSLVNIDRNSLIALLSSESEAAKRVAGSVRHRTAFQRAKRQEAAERTARIDRILLFLRDGKIPAEMSESDLAICKSLEQKLCVRSQP